MDLNIPTPMQWRKYVGFYKEITMIMQIEDEPSFVSKMFSCQVTHTYVNHLFIILYISLHAKDQHGYCHHELFFTIYPRPSIFHLSPKIHLWASKIDGSSW